MCIRDRTEFEKAGLPPQAREACLAHERYHEQQCRAGGSSRSDLDRLGTEEVGAYGKALDIMQRWLNANCPGSRSLVP